MALKLDYVMRETGNSFRRNFTLTLASILTIAVSLALFGSSLLFRQAVTNATLRWKGNVQVIVFLNADATNAQRDAVKRQLESDPDVKKVTYVDKNQAYSEFKRLYKDQPQDIIDSVTPDILPTSYRVVPRQADIDSVIALTNRYSGKPGVYYVATAADAIRKVQRITRLFSTGIAIVAFVLLGTALVLIVNTIRTAMFARRREIEVMKLVGATNWFIRVPFMLEGIIQAAVGSAVAVGAILALNWLFKDKLSGSQSVEVLQSFVVSGHDVFNTSATVVLVGLAVGLIGSAFAVNRFLDV